MGWGWWVGGYLAGVFAMYVVVRALGKRPQDEEPVDYAATVVVSSVFAVFWPVSAMLLAAEVLSARPRQWIVRRAAAIRGEGE